jgi:hypothetical protein
MPYGVYCYQVMPFGLKTQEQLINGWCKIASESK